jgi:hypothetical protein
MYGGTDYALTSDAITVPKYSNVKIPSRFPMSPTKWIVKVKDTVSHSTATPSADTYYNTGYIAIKIPIGAWTVDYTCVLVPSDAALSGQDITTLSTANNSESDSEFTSFNSPVNIAASMQQIAIKDLLLTSETLYYLNHKTDQASIDYLILRGDKAPTIVRAKCAYL